MAETAASVPKDRNLIARVTAWALSVKPVRAFLLYSEHRGPMLADSVTYRTLFSVFAGVLLGFSLAALWLSGNPTAWQALIDGVNAAIPGLLGEDGLIDPDDIKAPAGLTVAGILAFVGLVGAGIGAIGSLRAALHILADKVHDDVFWVWVLLRNLLLAIGIGAAFAAAAAVSFVGTAGVNVILGWFGVSENDVLGEIAARVVSIVVVFVLDAVAIAVLFLALSGVKPSARSLWSGAVLGAVGLIILQQLSGLFVGGASSNPLLASFASLIALLLWFNLSAQVILIASAYIITGVEEETDRVKARHGASTFAQRRVRRAEASVRVATEELRHARADEEKERRGDDDAEKTKEPARA
ncbi:YihY/virulence factor BrkB family protein [Microbacterium sp. BK668]|uniref:YihY/virulence factor BrkB family protein n=1 Tax=Microbacterium sp. BK668 TaxID=2512118 RepID=UPI00105E14A2|nr:YihY/virulence factor BrkB family protein [Microbacterium sp. BK668]TDN93224.1 membrane protein [Microbacterium sp. BK668]